MRRGNNRRGRNGRSNSKSFGSRPRQSRGQNRIRYMNVDPRMLVKKAEKIEESGYESELLFHDLKVENTLKINIKNKGYESPTPIQDKAVPEILEGRDVMGIASTGTGKTAAFLIPLINKVIRGTGERVLVIVPTRELASQIIDEGRELSLGMRVKYCLVIGGNSIHRQGRELRDKPEFVIGTPGRLKDLCERKMLYLGDFRSIVLDEVDRMLDMGFVRDMRDLIGRMPRERQSLFFSATMNDGAKQIAHEFLKDPVEIQISTQRPSDNVDQDILRVNGRSKVDLLHELLIQPEYEKVLVFGRTKRGTERLLKELVHRGFSASTIHGNKSQGQRQRALDDFRSNRVKILLATDVASRGIDIDEVSHVINYELPETYEDYIHRIGRTGRAGRIGKALTFID